MAYTKAELAAIDADAAWWKELADALGWRLYGFTYRSGATYADARGQHIELTGLQRDDIMCRLNGDDHAD